MDGEPHQSGDIGSVGNAPILPEEAGPGEGRLVVLIHGSLDRGAGMARLARAVAHHARVLRYDRRGYGRSWPHAGPFDVSAQVEDLKACLSGRRAVLVGHSFGGHIALRAAEELPGQIDGVTVYESPMSWMPWWPSDTAGARAVAAGPERASETFLVRLLGQSAWEALPDLTKRQRRREGEALFGELAALRDGPPWTTAMIGCRVLCGVGSGASEHHLLGMRWLAGELNQAELVIVEGAGHGAPLSHPQAFHELLVAPHLR